MRLEMRSRSTDERMARAIEHRVASVSERLVPWTVTIMSDMLSQTLSDTPRFWRSSVI